MPAQYTVAEIVGAFRELYQTIDVRTALLNHEDRWRSICLAIRIIPDSTESAKRKFQELEARYGKLNSTQIRILQDCHPFEEFDHIASALKEAWLFVGDIKRIPLDKAIDIVSLRGQIEQWLPRSIHTRSRLGWPVLRVSTQLSAWDALHGFLQGNREILRCVEVAGYQDPYAAIRHLLEIDFSSSHSSILVVEPAVPARLEPVRAILGEKGRAVLNISVAAHRAATKLRCTVRHERREGQQRLMQQRTFPLAPAEVEGTLRMWMGTAELEAADGSWSDNDWIYVEVVHEDIGHLYDQGHPFRELLRPEERNPLFVALTRFCPWEQIKRLLESPAVAEPPAKVSLNDKAKLFEVSVQWLLSSLGFRAIWLHGYEKLKEGKFDYGSIDCLAYHDEEKVLLLVNCTTGPPDPHEMNRQLEIQRLLLNSLFHSTTVRLASAVFTATHNPDTERVHFTPNRFKIFYHEDMAKLLALIGSGQEGRIVDAIFSPLFQGLE